MQFNLSLQVYWMWLIYFASCFSLRDVLFNIKLRTELLIFQLPKAKKDAVYMQLQQHVPLGRFSQSNRYLRSLHMYKTHPAFLKAGQSLTRNKYFMIARYIKDLVTLTWGPTEGIRRKWRWKKEPRLFHEEMICRRCLFSASPLSLQPVTNISDHTKNQKEKKNKKQM